MKKNFLFVVSLLIIYKIGCLYDNKIHAHKYESMWRVSMFRLILENDNIYTTTNKLIKYLNYS